MKKSELQQIIREEISRLNEANADFSISEKIVKLLKAAQKLIEDNIENAQNIDLEEMGQQIDEMVDQLNLGFEVYDED